MEALARVLAAAFRKRPLQSEEPDDASDSKRAKLELDGGLREEQPDDVQRGPPEEATREVSAVDGLAALALLECPVCVDMMESPVRQCINGHCVCNACRARVSACPLCRGPLSFSTHAAMDLLARTLTLRCVHAECPERIKVVPEIPLAHTRARRRRP